MNSSVSNVFLLNILYSFECSYLELSCFERASLEESGSVHWIFTNNQAVSEKAVYLSLSALDIEKRLSQFIILW